MTLEQNNPKKAGQPASKKALFGENNRYAIQAIHTRFEAIEWFVWDAINGDGEPKIIRQSDSYGEAINGLMDSACSTFSEDPYICDDCGHPKGQCENCGFHESDHAQNNGSRATNVNHALWVAVEHLATSGNPRHNWPQFISLVESTGQFESSQIERWNDLHKSAL